ncbi:MAG TPA: hypothetical protein VG265_02590 [Gaiellaceae bacterium]|jgi:hypothetical protein|nr:hypothetical protein [Gaiellaceae bacterium]
MPSYRLLFPRPPDLAADETPTAHIDTGDKMLEVGDIVEHGGSRWEVTQAPLEQPDAGETADVMVWPAD